MPVTDEVISIYAGARGFLDDLPVSEVQEFEKGLLEKVKNQYAELYREIEQKKQLTDEARAKLDEIIQQFKGSRKKKA
jgi:F-type H+-transporting ATPase subunit alpha